LIDDEKMSDGWSYLYGYRRLFSGTRYQELAR